MLKTVIATKDFDFEGRHYVKGERFDARPIVVAALTYQHKARFLTDADDVQPFVVPTTPEPELEIVTPRRRRAYRRRDLRPEP